MQIIPFPAHYQSVYTHFDISSFSLISCIAKAILLEAKSSPFEKRWSRNDFAGHGRRGTRPCRTCLRMAATEPSEPSFADESLENLNRKTKNLHLWKYIVTLHKLGCIV